MSQTNMQDTGFVPVPDQVDDSVNYPEVAPELFRELQRVVYHGTKTVGRDRNVLHILAPATEPDNKHVLWGSAMLNRKLEKVGAGEVVVIRYLGKEPHPNPTLRAEGKEQHVWEVGRAKDAAEVKAGASSPARPAAKTSW